MSERAIYTAMNAEGATMVTMRMATNNLANVNTPGFRADFPIIAMHPVNENEQHNTRTLPYAVSAYSDFEPGSIAHTGNPLDVAIAGNGFFAVQNQEGKEGYTRAGNMRVNQDGLLVTGKGHLVLGADGPITLPHNRGVSITKDGIVQILPLGGTERDLEQAGRIKLVEPKLSELSKGEDGLLYLGAGSDVEASENVKLTPESLEDSNVNSVTTLVDLIDASRRFEFAARVTRAVDEKTTSSNQLLEDLA